MAKIRKIAESKGRIEKKQELVCHTVFGCLQFEKLRIGISLEIEI
jgi:hypothetical protein